MPTKKFSRRVIQSYWSKNVVCLRFATKMANLNIFQKKWPETATLEPLEVPVEPRSAAVEHVAAPVEPVLAPVDKGSSP